MAAIANGGKILQPSILSGGLIDPVADQIDFAEDDWRVVREGMRAGVTSGTSAILDVPFVEAAAKTGTAEVGSAKKYIHSWSVGFFPYEHPRYAWAVVMERGPSTNTLGATSVVRKLFDWMSVNTPEYFR